MMPSTLHSAKARSLLLVGCLTIVCLQCSGDGSGLAPPDGPSIGLSESDKSFSAEQGGEDPPAQAVAVANAGAATLDGLTAEVSYAEGEPAGWLDAELSGITAPAVLTLSASPGSLRVGNYTATVSVASPVAGNSPQTVTITLGVTEPPEGLLFSVSSDNDGLSTINPRTGVGLFIGRLGGANSSLYTDLSSMAVTLDHPLNRSVMYVWSNSGDGTDPGAVTGRLLTVNTATGEATPVNAGAPSQGSLTAMTLSSNGTIYGTDLSRLYRVDPETGTRSSIVTFGSGYQVRGMDMACDGTIWLASTTAGLQTTLLTFNTGTGSINQRGTLSQDIGTIGSIAFSRTGTLIGSASGHHGVILFDIDTSTAQVSNLRPVSGVNVSTPEGMGFVRSAFGCRTSATISWPLTEHAP